MPSQYDPSDFIDSDFEENRKSPYATGTMTASTNPESNRPPTREELDGKVSEAQIRLAELKRAQEELERERASLEEARRRQIEFQTGREEMSQALVRGLGLLEEAEFSARRDAEQMAKVMVDLRLALSKIQEIQQESWTKENYSMELTRALTTIENARMEWNAARLKFPVLSGGATEATVPEKTASPTELLRTLNFLQLCKLGFALTWPLVVLGLGIFIVLLLR